MRRGGMSLAIGFAGALVAVAMALLIGDIAKTMRNVKPARATVPPVSAVVWGDRVYLKPPALAHWLKTRGVGYSVWAERHPPANRLLKKHQSKR